MRFNLIQPDKAHVRIFSQFPRSGWRTEYEVPVFENPEPLFKIRGLVSDRGYLGPDADIFADDHPEMKFHRVLHHDHVVWYFYSEEDRSTFDRYCEHIADMKWAANVLS